MDPIDVDQQLELFQKLVGARVEGRCLYARSIKRLNSRVNLLQDMCSVVDDCKQVFFPTGENSKWFVIYVQN